MLGLGSFGENLLRSPGRGIMGLALTGWLVVVFVLLTCFWLAWGLSNVVPIRNIAVHFSPTGGQRGAPPTFVRLSGGIGVGYANAYPESFIGALESIKIIQGWNVLTGYDRLKIVFPWRHRTTDCWQLRSVGINEVILANFNVLPNSDVASRRLPVIGIVPRPKYLPRSLPVRNFAGSRLRHVHVWPFVNIKVVSQVYPLPHGHASIDNTRNYAKSFEPIAFEEEAFELSPGSMSKWPPWKSVLAGLLGIVGISWGWRNSRSPAWGSAAFICGCVFWAYACWVLLPWSAKVF
jgi:hypothetical protein